MPCLVLVRTDSTAINPAPCNEWHNSYFPIGEIIMAPRKRHSIISSLCNEIKKHPKFKSNKNDNGS
jgi:hypothetical protein